MFRSNYDFTKLLLNKEKEGGYVRQSIFLTMFQFYFLGIEKLEHSKE